VLDTKADPFQKLQLFLDKFSAGDTMNDQLRNFLFWLVEQTEGIDQTKLALKVARAKNYMEKH
jgi:hypothetical protein